MAVRPVEVAPPTLRWSSRDRRSTARLPTRRLPPAATRSAPPPISVAMGCTHVSTFHLVAVDEIMRRLHAAPQVQGSLQTGDLARREVTRPSPRIQAQALRVFMMWGLSRIQEHEWPRCRVGKYCRGRCCAPSGKVPVEGTRSGVQPSGSGKECQPQWDMLLPAKVCNPVPSAPKLNSPFPRARCLAGSFRVMLCRVTSA